MGAFGGRGSLASRVGILQDVLGTCPAPGLLPDLKHNRRDTSPTPKSKSSDAITKRRKKEEGRVASRCQSLRDKREVPVPWLALHATVDSQAHLGLTPGRDLVL